jgi:hypothetical protein
MNDLFAPIALAGQANRSITSFTTNMVVIVSEGSDRMGQAVIGAVTILTVSVKRKS